MAGEVRAIEEDDIDWLLPPTESETLCWPLTEKLLVETEMLSELIVIELSPTFIVIWLAALMVMLSPASIVMEAPVL